jgi:hypothetical protein
MCIHGTAHMRFLSSRSCMENRVHTRSPPSPFECEFPESCNSLAKPPGRVKLELQPWIGSANQDLWLSAPSFREPEALGPNPGNRGDGKARERDNIMRWNLGVLERCGGRGADFACCLARWRASWRAVWGVVGSRSDSGSVWLHPEVSPPHSLLVNTSTN